MDVKDFLARLKDSSATSPNQIPGAGPDPESSNYRPPAVFSPMLSPNIQTPEPRHGDVLSAKTTPYTATPAPLASPAPGASAADRTSTLLNLLKFNSPQTSAAVPPTSHSRTASSSEPQPPAASAAGRGSPSAGEQIMRSTSHNNQDMLLSLLKRQAPSQIAQNSSSQSILPTPASTAGPMFSFVSPFDQLAASSPRNRTPQPDAPFTNAAKKQQVPTTEKSDTVAQALADIGQQVDNDVSKALDNVMPENVDDKKGTQTLDNVADSWESAEASEEAQAETVKVFNFPMRPFVCIDVRVIEMQPARLRHEILMKIASLKKQFDQVDRTLTTATSNFIIYAMSKGGGIRVIRQDDGSNKACFRGEGKEVFNLAASTETSTILSTPQPAEAILATAVNGSVYWTSVPISKDGFESADLDDRGFVFPPPTSQDDPLSTAQLKTRAKMSSRHSEFFAVGRGKSIHFVWPSVAASGRYFSHGRTIDSDKYLSERSLKIATGKAGKDFAFSQDDTVIVSLDKVGRLKFWDITTHTKSEHGSLQRPFEPVEVKIPIMTYWAAAPTEKSSPTSVLFVDKERPMTKGYALRYLLIGMKQNHTIQLWDLGLGKAVQEINLPHENENDAICSIAYHSKTGMIVVGHPTRNTVYLIHLSAPKYNLSSSMNQATYIKRLSSDDPSLPRPESTAIMSGMRELSLENMGQLRSLDVHNPTPTASDEEETVFEIYAIHSKGVSCLHMKHRDLGWGSDGKILQALDAEAQGAIVVTSLKQPSAAHSEIANGEAHSDAGKATSRAPNKPQPKSSPPTAAPAETAISGKVKAAKDIKMEELAGATAATTYASAAQKTMIPEPERNILASTPAAANPPSLSEVALSKKLDQLYERLDADKRIAEASHHARQDAVLRLVSSTLTDNTEKSLERIITTTIDAKIVPKLANTVQASIDRQLAEVVTKNVSNSLPQELKGAVSKALQEPKTLQAISQEVSPKLVARIDAELKTALQNIITPAFKKLATDAASTMTVELENRLRLQSSQFEAQREADNQKISELTSLVRSMSEIVAIFPSQITELQNRIAELNSNGNATPAAMPPAPIGSQDPEFDTIKSLMGNPETVNEALTKWLQSDRRDQIFDSFILHFDKSVVASIDPILGLSFLAYIGTNLSEGTPERLDWLQLVLRVTNFKAPEAEQHAASVLDFVTQKLQDLYMSISENEVGSPMLSRIHAIVRLARERKSAVLS